MMKNRLQKLMPKATGFLLPVLLFSMGIPTTFAHADLNEPSSLSEKIQSIVNGTVTDEDGIPLPGASVVVKGTSTGAVTDFDGNYSIEVASDAVLIFSYIGYTTTEIAVGGQSTVNASLPIDAGQLEEVVVVGYGTQKKKNLTGSVGIADAERLENRPITSAGQGLQGVVPNLNISIRNGDPTESAEFNIRGFTSINGGSPLILVDGVPMDLERINPNDIKSVSVLKDASAAAVYGARGAFGVILVETKKGRAGKTTINFSTQQSYAKPIFHIDPVTDPYDLVTYINKATVNTSGQPRYDDEFVAGTLRYSQNPTFENAWDVVNGNLRFYGDNDYNNKAIADFSPQQTYDFSISGATEKASYYVSFGYLSKTGYINNTEKNEKFSRYNILMKTDYQVNDWLNLDSKIVYNNQNSDKPHFYNWDVNINTVARVTAITPLEFPDLPYYQTPGDRATYEPLIGKYFGTFFPYLEDGGRDTFVAGDLWLTQGVTLDPAPGLKIRSNFSYNSFNRNEKQVASKIEIVSTDLNADPILTNGLSGNDFIEENNDRNEYYVFNAFAEYEFNADRTEKDHFVKAMIGFNQEWGHKRYFSARAQTLITPLITNISATTGAQTTGGNESDFSLRGAFYRFNYIYKDRYLFEANGRYDGTSRFPTDDRFGFFPSFSAGWIVSEESFMENASGWLDQFKIRGSWGSLGNQAVEEEYGNYPYISSLNSNTSPYILGSGRTPYVSPGGLVSPTLTWETVESKNLGVDLSLFKNKLAINADFYTRDTKDMLMSIEYPGILGTNGPAFNAADLRTKGWELSLTWRDTFGDHGRWGLNLALSDSQSEITKYINPEGALSEFYVGQKLGEIWGYETVGIFQTDAEVAAAPDQSPIGNNWSAGDMQYADLNGDGKIDSGSSTLGNSGDRKVIGNETARYSFGINPDIKYKNWSLDLFFQGLFRDYLPSNGNWNAFYPNNANLVEKYYLTESWSPDNPNAYFAKPLIGTSDKRNILPQSRYVQNAAYIRLKNVTLSYNLPSTLLEDLGMSKGQLYLSGQNLWESTKMHKPLDPESIFTVTQEYYLQRIITFGVNVSF
ncbi:SusC/RagA family TonB-linked outer membrane protein [Kriegella aquimaris]|uniref:TonB-linked outer membrane protein, SusC/RagA family n=1 Tax=Kriegella aquimaris TaxID=192904 RepID=A0A1G9IN62_9FLAO|nr:TonB-dependent receptor [Kriegella aquimaris]SDL26739.1 TonB-linked outer membrane protein, SusC/RagA family [Kriegella aquimaris]